MHNETMGCCETREENEGKESHADLDRQEVRDDDNERQENHERYENTERQEVSDESKKQRRQ